MEDMGTLLQFQNDNAGRERTIARSRTFADALRSAVRRERYWLGENLYSRFVLYHNVLQRYLDMVLLNQKTEADGAKRAMNRLKQDIMVTLDSDLIPSSPGGLPHSR